MKHIVACLFMTCSFLYGETVGDRTAFLSRLVHLHQDELIDIRTSEELVSLIHFCVDIDADLCPGLSSIADYIHHGRYLVPAGLVRAALLELQQFQLTRTHQTEILSLQLAAVGLGLNFESSSQPFTTKVAQQQSLETGATQSVKIASAEPPTVGLTPSPVRSGFTVDIGTGYGALADQSPQTITIGSPGTTTTIIGAVNIPAPIGINSLTSGTHITLTTRNASANPAVFTFDNTDGSGNTSSNATMQSTGSLTLTAATNTVIDAPSAVQVGASTATSVYIGNAAANTTVVNAQLTAQNGTSAAPSINFIGSPTTGLSAATVNTLALSTNAVERLRISSSGTVSINQFNAAGVVHNTATGELFSALVSTTDTTATSTNTPSRLVARDAGGNFAAGTITATLNGNATTASSATNFTGSLAGDVTGTQGSTAVAFVGGQSASNVATATTLANAATSLNTPSAIVRRDGTGSFNAGTVTAQTSVLANTIDTRTVATLSVGGANATAVTITPATTLQNTLTVPSGTAAAPSIRFGASTSSGLFAPVADSVSLTAAGSEKLRVTAAGLTVPSFTTAGVVHNSAAGLLSSSLIVNGDITAGTIANDRLATIATADTPGAIVLRDGTGNFTTHMITIDGTPTVSTDVATVGFVNAAVASGFTVLSPALYASTNAADVSNPPSGTATIDGAMVATGNRVLLTAQTNPVYNGLWDVVTTGLWTRPSDFANGNDAGNSYVLVTGGLANVNTGWVCTTPTAVIDTNPIYFTLFSQGSTTTGANLGVSATTGQVYKNKVASVLNFRSIAPGDSHITVQNNAMTGDTVDIATDATSSNTISTIVARDSSGNFTAGTITAALTGAASLNVLKAGDTMTGPLLMANQQPIRFGDTTAHYVGLQAPTTVGTNYTVSLPAVAPLSGQYLQASSASALQWSTIGGLPAATKIYYVALNGSDSNDGSIASPYRTVSYAVQQANAVATFANPVVINIGAGIFVEDNSGGPLRITASGISLVGQSYTGTIIKPSTPAIVLFEITDATLTSSQQVIMQNMLLDASGLGSTNAAISVIDTQSSMPYYSSAIRLDSLVIRGFQTGVQATSNTGISTVTVENLTFRGNATAVSVQNTLANIKNSLIFGPLLGSATTPVNTGVSVQASSGYSVSVNILGTLFSQLDTGMTINGAIMRVVGCEVEKTVNGFIASNAAVGSLTGVNFASNPVGAVNVSASGTDTFVTLDGCHFNCTDATGTAAGTALQVQQRASMIAAASSITRAALGISCGLVSDTATTVIKADGVVLIDCTADILQRGSSTLRFLGGVFESNVVTINDPTNVNFSAYDRNANDSLMIGSGANIEQPLYQVFNTLSAPYPTLSYKPTWYTSQATVYTDSGVTGTGVMSVTNNAQTSVVVQDRTKTASLLLLSDTGSIGSTDKVIQWSITKRGTGQPDLTFDFSNNDITPTIDQYTCMRLNGFANQILFPLVTTVNQPTYTTARLSWAGDTSLYRAGAGTLQTDGNMNVAQALTTINGAITAGNNTAAATGGVINLYTSRAGGAIISGDTLGSVVFQGNDGTSAITTSQIVATSSGTVGTNRIGSNLAFYTHPDSTTASTQRMVINSAGNVTVQAADTGAALTVNGPTLIAPTVASTVLTLTPNGNSTGLSIGSSGTADAIVYNTNKFVVASSGTVKAAFENNTTATVLKMAAATIPATGSTATHASNNLTYTHTNGTGVYVITVANMSQILGCSASVQATSGAKDRLVFTTPQTTGGVTTITVHTYDGNSLTDLPFTIIAYGN